MAQKYKDTIDCLIKELDSSAIKSCLFQSEKNNSTYKVRTISVDKRIEADKDYSSIIQSGYFRRLEDKTQVFALAKDNHRRTRLTHSIEVSSVGEQLGNNCIDIIRRSYLVGYKGKERDSLIKIINTIPLILRNACLVHDLGNPPFGHKGEFMIGEWVKNNLSRYTVYFNGAFCTFDKYLASKKKNKSIRNLETLLSDNNLLNDLCFFEGNAQNIRILNSLIYTSRSGFSKALFRAIGKYTSDIDTYLANKNVDTSSIKIENKKLGYYKSEEKIAEIIFKDFNSKRSFLAYLVEASDDIAYSISDLEDSLSKNLISVEQLKNEIISEYKKINSIEETAIKEIFSSENYNGGMFLRLLKKHPYEGSEDLYARIKKNEDRKGYYNNIILLIDAYLTEKNKNEELSNKRLDYTINAIKKAKYYRGQESYELERIENVIRGYLISSSTEYFKYYFKSLVEGKYEFGSIVNNCSCNFIHSAIVKCMEKYVYNSELVRNKEIIAMKIIDTIMTNLFNTILNIDLPKEYKNKLYEQFEYLLGKKHLNAYYKSIQKCSSKNTENTIANIIYYKVRLLIDTVSAMTDSYALFIYQNMEAII